MTTPLAGRLARRMTARDFMAAALYDPEHGYYAKGPEIGARGDFYTAANVSLFAPALRRFVDAARAALGGQARVVELGGGTGALGAALGVDAVVEPHAGLAARQRARGLRVVPSMDALDPAPSVVLGNEVLDALPVHRLVGTDDGPREIYVAPDGAGGFREAPGPLSDPRLEAFVDARRAWLEPGLALEACLDVDALLAAIARAAPRAIVLFLDYGGGPEELYGPSRPRGSLRGYHQHRPTGPYERPGEQDMTADVDFDWIRARARDAGFVPIGYATQGRFLMGCGLVEEMAQAQTAGDLQAYLAAKHLLLPGGMGERFKALALARGLDGTPRLPGFGQEGPW